MIEAKGLISRNVAEIQISAIKEMAMLGAKASGSVSLAWGLPSFRTPKNIRIGVAKAFEGDVDIGKYALPDGLPELREAVAATHFAETGIRPDPDKNVMITAGNMQGLNALFHVLINPGDEVIVTDPGFPSHIQQIRLCGGVPRYWTLDEAKAWSLDLDALPNLISAKTKAIVLVSPSNPTGKIFSEEELRKVGQLALAQGLMILLDDPYSHFTYENRDRYFNLASLAELQDHIAYLFTFSKTYAMSGWRLGYMIVPEAIKREVLKVHDATIICTPRISQVAGYVALSEAAPHLRAFEEILNRRRALICKSLAQLPHIFDFIEPEGAYYVFPRIVAEHSSSHDFAIQLLNDTGVVTTPGGAFGPNGEHHLRMAFCVSEEVIEEAFARMVKYFNA